MCCFAAAIFMLNLGSGRVAAGAHARRMHTCRQVPMLSGEIQVAHQSHTDAVHTMLPTEAREQFGPRSQRLAVHTGSKLKKRRLQKLHPPATYLVPFEFSGRHVVSGLVSVLVASARVMWRLLKWMPAAAGQSSFQIPYARRWRTDKS